MNRKSDTLIAVAYNGEHFKMREGFINGMEHQKMLIDAILNVNPDNEFDVLVSANKFSIMDIPCVEEREHAWEIYKHADVISLRDNHGHQMGQAWAILQALKVASVRGYEYIFWTGEDVLYDDPFMVRNCVQILKDQGAAYLGRHWGHQWELDAQVFAARVDVMLNRFVPADFAARGGVIEPYLFDVLRDEKVVLHMIWHHHEHDPARFNLCVAHAKQQQKRIREEASKQGTNNADLQSA